MRILEKIDRIIMVLRCLLHIYFCRAIQITGPPYIYKLRSTLQQYLNSQSIDMVKHFKMINKHAALPPVKLKCHIQIPIT